jgi:hypothetical protein
MKVGDLVTLNREWGKDDKGTTVWPGPERLPVGLVTKVSRYPPFLGEQPIDHWRVLWLNIMMPASYTADRLKVINESR